MASSIADIGAGYRRYASRRWRLRRVWL